MNGGVADGDHPGHPEKAAGTALEERAYGGQYFRQPLLHPRGQSLHVTADYRPQFIPYRPIFSEHGDGLQLVLQAAHPVQSGEQQGLPACRLIRKSLAEL